MVTIREMATEMATSDAGQVFGFKGIPEEKNLMTIGALWADFALRVSHWVPGMGTITGLISLTLLAVRVQGKQQVNDEDVAELVRDLLAITGSIYALIILDVGATYLRSQQEVAAHKQFDYYV